MKSLADTPLSGVMVWIVAVSSIRPSNDSSMNCRRRCWRCLRFPFEDLRVDLRPNNEKLENMMVTS